MIDTDKYEGHTPMWYLNTIGVDGITGQWRIESDFTTHDGRVVAILRSENEADAQLMADAPDLLIELKRLRKIEQEHGRVIIDDWEHKPLGDADAYPLPYVTVYHGGCEYVGLLRLHKNEDGEVIE